MAPTTLIAVMTDHPSRAEAEACARRSYDLVYGARLGTFPPRLMALAEAGGIQAVAGLRTVEDGFFCERYLGDSLSCVLARHTGSRVDARTVVEVTSLAAARPAAFLRLVTGLRTWIPRHGFEWAVFTATRRLRRTLVGLDLSLISLAKADSARVENAADWGSYYATDPAVCAVARHQLLMRSGRRAYGGIGMTMGL
jgi:hypothetical protein